MAISRANMNQQISKGIMKRYQEGGEVNRDKLFGGLFDRANESSDVDILSGLIRSPSRVSIQIEESGAMAHGGMTGKSSRDGKAVRGRTKGRMV